MTDFPNALPKEHRLHEYEIVRVLGVGGFGVTYLAWDHHLNKGVAIKEYLPNDLAVRVEGTSVHPKSSSDRDDFQWGLDRFLDEARTLARFDHPSIIRVIRFFEANDTAYIVMDYAEGKTLAAHLRDYGTLDEEELKDILMPLLDGLEQVHQADLLHRDIKPDNIIIRADGSPVLIDFGAARQQVIGRSRSVSAIVSPGYSPIEQYSTKSKQGPWTDIYALGAVCYIALTGERLPEAADRVRVDPLGPVKNKAAGLAIATFLEAVDHAIAVFDDDRPQTIAQWRTSLLIRQNNGEPEDFEKESKSRSRPPHKSLILLVGVMLTIGLGLGIWWTNGSEPDKKQYSNIQDPLRAGLMGPEMTVHEHSLGTLLAGSKDEIGDDLFRLYMDDMGIARREVDCLAWMAPHLYGPGTYAVSEVSIPPYGYDSAVCLTYQEITAFTQWLSAQSGRSYRLPEYWEMEQILEQNEPDSTGFLWTRTCTKTSDDICIRYQLFGISNEPLWLTEDQLLDEDASFRASYIKFRLVSDDLTEDGI